ncbi:hypothetical protein OROMI_003286 [Orobanche minor]
MLMSHDEAFLDMYLSDPEERMMALRRKLKKYGVLKKALLQGCVLCMSRERIEQETHGNCVGRDALPSRVQENREVYGIPTWVKHSDRQYCAKNRVQMLLDDNESRRGQFCCNDHPGCEKGFQQRKILKDLKKQFCCNGIVVNDLELGHTTPSD